MTNLPTVTLIGYDGPKVDRTVRVMNYCQKMFQFGAVKLWSSFEPTLKLDNGTVIPTAESGHKGSEIWEINGIEIETEHCLFVSHDGFIVNPARWNPEWLRYDFIGAPWRADMIDGSPHRVGNTGFCLRSKFFIDMCKLAYPFYKLETYGDVFQCRVMRDTFEYRGIKFAPVWLADMFSFESVTGGCELTAFGFHGSCQGLDYDEVLNRYAVKNGVTL